MATRAETRLPYGVGQTGAGFFLLVVVLLALVALGVYAYSRQFIEGEVVTGMRDIGTMGGAAWGLYIAFVVHFVGVSFAGITVAALIRIMNLEHLKPIARMAEALTVVALVLGAFSVLVDLGQPARGIVNLFLYARPYSPFFGTFSLVLSGYLFASLVYLYLEGRRDAALLARKPSRLQGFYRLWAAGYGDTPEERARHDRTAWWLALAVIPLLVTAHSTLGFVFGLQGGAAGWYSALQAPGFVVMAGVSGIGHIIVLAFIARYLLKLQDQITLHAFAWLGNLLWVLVLTYLYLLVVEVLSGVYAAHHHEARVSEALLRGDYAWLFWLAVGMLLVSFLLLFLQFVRRSYSLWAIVVPGVLVGFAGILKRYLIVVPSQTHGRLLPYLTGSYSPSWVEILVIVGLLALGALALVLFFKVFPIMEVPDGQEGR
ncbi:MAG: polysulfide reductase NrfD [Chloroflexi bacterium]|nr:polysulfide reductase NrfD [Chloroflexota bacterium]